MQGKIYLYVNFNDGLSFTNKIHGLELRLAGNPNFLLQEIFHEEIEKLGDEHILSDIDKELARENAIKRLEDMLELFTLKRYKKYYNNYKDGKYHKPSPFILYNKKKR